MQHQHLKPIHCAPLDDMNECIATYEVISNIHIRLAQTVVTLVLQHINPEYHQSVHKYILKKFAAYIMMLG